MEHEQIVPSVTAQFPDFLNLITLTSHFEILNICKTIEEQIFYILYAHKERLSLRDASLPQEQYVCFINGR